MAQAQHTRFKSMYDPTLGMDDRMEQVCFDLEAFRKDMKPPRHFNVGRCLSYLEFPIVAERPKGGG